MRQPSSVRRMRRINAHKPQLNSYFCGIVKLFENACDAVDVSVLGGQSVD